MTHITDEPPTELIKQAHYLSKVASPSPTTKLWGVVFTRPDGSKVFDLCNWDQDCESSRTTKFSHLTDEEYAILHAINMRYWNEAGRNAPPDAYIKDKAYYQAYDLTPYLKQSVCKEHDAELVGWEEVWCPLCP